MATSIPAQSRVISTPTIYVSDVLVPIVPNSCKWKIPGEVKVRAISSGGGNVSIVAGVNAEKFIAGVEFEIPVTAANIAMIRAWRANANNSMTETVQIVDPTANYPFDSMYLQNEPEADFKSDGNMKCIFEGRYVG